MKKNQVRNLTFGALIAALYVGLTFVSQVFGLASGAVQLRLSEALTILPLFCPAAVPGLAVGCLLANWLTGCALWDVIFGTVATLLGAIGTRLLKRHKLLAVLPPIAANTVIVPLLLRYVYELPDAMWYLFLTVFLGELISCGVFGTLLRKLLEKTGLDKKLPG
jgi:uncharacterized membrane protein